MHLSILYIISSRHVVITSTCQAQPRPCSLHLSFSLHCVCVCPLLKGLHTRIPFGASVVKTYEDLLGVGGHLDAVTDVWGNLGCCRAGCGQKRIWTHTSLGTLCTAERYLDQGDG